MCDSNCDKQIEYTGKQKHQEIRSLIGKNYMKTKTSVWLMQKLKYIVTKCEKPKKASRENTIQT